MEVSTSICEWYQNETIFLTGGSGYIGKGLIYKLLKCGCQKIYLLIRVKKGQNPDERLEAIANHWVFDSLKENGIDVRPKLVAISGDVTLPQLGISDKDREILQENVTVVIHAAASVKFDDPLKMAVFYNLRSARDVVELSKGIKKLKILHHVSTAFCNIDHKKNGQPIQEKIYPPKMDWRKLIEFVENHSDEIIEAVTQKIIHGFVNTYLFTKHLAEAVMSDAAAEIPVTISRPAIVVCSLYEPDVGWMDNLYGPVISMAGCGKGLVRVYTGSATVIRAYTPLDVVVNMILVMTWDEALAKNGVADGQVKIYNGDYCPATEKDLFHYMYELILTSPLPNMLRFPRLHSTLNENLFLFYHLIEHVLFGVIVDLILLLSGKKPILLRLYRKIYIALMNLLPIVITDDLFDTTNYQTLVKQVPKNEQSIFYLHVPKGEELKEHWVLASIRGLRKFIGDPLVPAPKDYVHANRVYWLEIAFFVLLSFLFLWLVPPLTLAAPFLHIYNSVVNFFNFV